MRKPAWALVVGSLACASVAAAQQPAPAAKAAPPAQDVGSLFGIVCQYVVTAQVGAKPTKLCLTKAEWEAKKMADARDATRIVCKYDRLPGTRFRSAKVCLPATQWDENRRLEREAVESIQRSVCVAGAGC